MVQALEGADAAVIVTDWPMIKEIDLYDVTCPGSLGYA